MDLPQSLRDKQAEAIDRAKAYYETHGDPVDALEAILSEIVQDPERWQRIIDEPYG